MKSYNSTINNDKTEEEDWCIECSDDEKYNPTQEKKGVWQPKPEDIISLFEKLEKEKFIELRWQCPGRRPPESEKEETETPEPTVEKEVVEEQPKEEEKRPSAPSEFDFDDMDSTTSTVITPRRTPGASKTPRSVKKVARMDNVLNDIKRRRDADREARRSMLGRSPVGSPGRSMGGMTGVHTPYRPTHPVTSSSSNIVTSSSSNINSTPVSSTNSDQNKPTENTVSTTVTSSSGNS